jgi:hypothetical protein
MVDINLIGDDQTDFEGEEKKREFQNTYETDSNEPVPSSYTSRGTMDDADYTLGRGRSKKTIYLLIFSSIILLAVVVYFLLQQGKGKKAVPETTATQTETLAVDDTSGGFGLDNQPGTAMGIALDPSLREKITTNYRGINTVNTIIKTIPANVNFTMISYSDGKFLLEFLANSDADINNVNSQLQQSLSPSEINLLSKETRSIQNKQVRQALVNGNVNLNQSLGDITISQEPTYLSTADLKNQLTTICQQAGLSIKQYDSGLEKSEGAFRISPIKFQAVGQKANVLAFLQQLLNQNLNISFSKISLINLHESNITLVLNINLYRM